MNKSFTENLNMKGHLTISKIANGEEEVIFDEKNVIVLALALEWLISSLN
jgi:hypothetical protein